VRLGGALDARTLQQLGGIEMSTRKLLRLVDDLLILASGRESKLRLKIAAVDLARLLDIVVATWRPVAEQKGLSIAFGGPARCVRNVDEEKLERVVTNLISNAIKFTPRGGTVRLAARADARSLVVSVADTGIGIARADLPRLFREFEQLAQPNGTRPEGTGLGLALSRRLVELHGGRVEVDSELGRGSTFSVHLPLKSPDETTGIRIPGLTI